MPSEAEVRPFRVDLPDEAIADLRRRIAAMRLPSKELVGDRSQGVQLATIQELARYWAADYDWRACEAKLNALPQAAALADRAAAHAAPDNPWAVATLLDSLREAGADEQAAALAARLPAAGMFGLFLKQQGPADHFRFGREADGAPAAPWGWEDLDLWLVPRARGRRHRNRRDDLNNRRPNRSDQLFEALVTDAANANFTWAGHLSCIAEGCECQT